MGLNVGMGGHALHGEYGPAFHTYGLALDFVIEATAVLADGSVVKASTTENSSLFWALHGAGCFFRIVTEMKFRQFLHHSRTSSFTTSIYGTRTQALARFQALQNYANSTMQPPGINMRVVIAIFTRFSHLGSRRVYHGSEADIQAAAEPLLAELGPTYLTINSTFGWMDSLLYVNNNRLLPGGTDE